MRGNKQLNVLDNIYSNIKLGLELGKTLIMLQGSARCFAAGTKIRMADGTLKCVEDIEVGDKVMSSDGVGSNTVTSVHEGTDNMYRIHPHRSQNDIIVNSNHILSLKRTSGGYSHGRRIPFDANEIINIPVSEYIKKSQTWQSQHSIFRNTLIRMPERELPIDPYYLGVWLGDGTAARWHEISNSDKEILDWFGEFARQMGTEVINRYDCTWFMKVSEAYRAKKINDKCESMYRAFVDLNLINNKHVPDIYIYNSYENRLKLLAGLLDTDGYNTGRNTLSITQKNRQIAEAIVELCNTCGFHTNGIVSKIAKMKRADGSVYECEVYIVEINHNNFNDLNKYMKVERKKVVGKNCERDYFKTKIDVECVGVGKYYGFSLKDNPYLIDNQGVILHNSGKTYNTLIYLILECLQNPVREREVVNPVTRQKITLREPLKISIVRESLPVIRRSVYEDFRNILIDIGQWDDRCMNKTEWRYTFPNGAVVEFFSAEDEQKLRGPWRHILYINEANEISFYSFSMLRQRTYEYCIIDYNPSFTEEHWIFPLMTDERSFHFISTYRDNIFLPEAAVQEIESYKTTNPALWQIFGKGEFAIVDGLVFPKENWDIIKDDDFPSWSSEGYIGLDWGFEPDPTVALHVIVEGREVYVKELFREQKLLSSDIATMLEPYRGIVKHCDIDKRLVAELELAGIPLLEKTVKNGESILTGIKLLNQRKIHICESSTDLIKEFKNYVYKKDHGGSYMTDSNPVDKFSHGPDALRYVMLAEFGETYTQRQERELTKEDLGLFM